MKTSLYLTFALILTCAFTSAQTIPNNGFENWTSMGSYNNPDAWASLNDMTAAMSTYTCVKGTPGAAGTGYLKLTSKTVAGMGVMPGFAVCGTVDMVTLQPTSGFAFTDRPYALSGNWQYMATGADQGFIGVALTKWNGTTMMRDTVAVVYHPLSGMAMSWANFSLTMVYLNGNDPDSCIIVCSASRANNVAAVANSYLYLDELAFTGTVTGISENLSYMSIVISPNPASEILKINLSSPKDKYASIEIYDVQGRLIKTFEKMEANSNGSVDIADLPKGNYVLKVIGNSGTATNNFIKQ